MVALLVVIIATLEIVLGRKKLSQAKGPFGDSVLKNPARYIHLHILLVSAKTSSTEKLGPLSSFCGRLGDQEILLVMNFDDRKTLQRILKDH